MKNAALAVIALIALGVTAGCSSDDEGSGGPSCTYQCQGSMDWKCEPLDVAACDAKVDSVCGGSGTKLFSSAASCEESLKQVQ